MIKAIYILNTAGKVRLVRVFDETVTASWSCISLSFVFLGHNELRGSGSRTDNEGCSKKGSLLQLYRRLSICYQATQGYLQVTHSSRC